jgi:hypothetical protein
MPAPVRTLSTNHTPATSPTLDIHVELWEDRAGHPGQERQAREEIAKTMDEVVREKSDERKTSSAWADLRPGGRVIADDDSVGSAGPPPSEPQPR